MRWLRPTVARDPSQEELEQVAATLDAAAAEAPPPRRAEEIRLAVLTELDAPRRPAPALAPLAFAAGAILLALAIGLAAPAVSNFIGTLLNRTPVPVPSEDPVPLPSPAERQDAEVPAVPMPTDDSLPTQDPVPSQQPPARGPDDRGTDESMPPATPRPTPTSAPAPPPSGPPIPIPTPPVTGPPPGTPGG